MPACRRSLAAATLALFALASGSLSAEAPDVLPGTERLDREGDVASQLVDACDAFLLRRLEASIAKRPDYWIPADAPPSERKPSVERLRKALGIVDERVPAIALEFVASTKDDGIVATVSAGERPIAIRRVRWQVFEDVYGEGLYLAGGDDPTSFAIVLPDADQTPEELCNLSTDRPQPKSLPLRLAQAGVDVVVPSLISREMASRNGRATLSHREYLHRSAFVLGRTMSGYEVQEVLALVDLFDGESPAAKIGVAGYGEGGSIALYAAAVDERIDATLVSGAFGNRDSIWSQPLDRQVVGLLREFGDGELAFMVHPRRMIVEPSRGPEVRLSGESGGAPATLESPAPEAAAREVARAQTLAGYDVGAPLAPLTIAEPEENVAFGDSATKAFLTAIGSKQEPGEAPSVELRDASWPDRAKERLARQVAALDRFNQRLLAACEIERDELFRAQNLDTSSPEAYEDSIGPYRDLFRREVIGEYDLPLADFHAKSRKTWETPEWTGYEVTLDVFDGVFAYGALLLPKDLDPSEHRPVVVCQHGLEGRPTDTFQGDHPAYHDFAGKLAERGFIVFCPQNLYIFKDRFRTLQRKSYPLGTTLFSIVVPQHQQIVNWLKTLPNVDGDRIGFYGLSYGGKSAMRIPALVTDYALSICSADFNEWVRKNASTKHDFSYVWTGEYEIFEFDLGRTFNYAEMAALIAPRPFMVERGHFDGVGVDEWVAYEYAKVRRLYATTLKLPERTEIEFFVGPHTINGQRSFAFLHEHLDWPTPEERAAASQ